MVKLAVFDGGRIVVQYTLEQVEGQKLDELFGACPQVDRAIVSSTRDSGAEIVEMIRPRVRQCLHFTPQTPVPISNAYHTPQTLGRDRLAAAVGAAALWSDRNVLVVDFGTALTIDLVTADGTFQGGFISPGVQSRFRSLHDYTGSLPLCNPSEEELPLGLTTHTAVTQGVMQGVAYEIEGHMARIGAQYGNLCTIFTGGDAKYFAKRIKNTIFANCNLVLEGLNRILEYNAS